LRTRAGPCGEGMRDLKRALKRLGSGRPIIKNIARTEAQGRVPARINHNGTGEN